MKSFSGSKKTNPNKANPSTPRSGSGQAWLRACPELVEATGFKRGGYAALRSAYKKTLFFALNLVKWTLGNVRQCNLPDTGYKIRNPNLFAI